MTTVPTDSPLATYRLNVTLRAALAGHGGPLPQIAATAMVELALLREAKHQPVGAQWATDTYLAVLSTLERRATVPAVPTRRPR